MILVDAALGVKGTRMTRSKVFVIEDYLNVAMRYYFALRYGL
ncbi:hypothetical protein DSUL_80089 [Desulfovibrionales bacterium]